MVDNIVTDEELLESVKHHDGNAFEKLLDRYENKVYQLAYKLTGSESNARDVIQEVFLTIYNKADTFRGESSLSSWIYKITANASYMFLRKKKKDAEISIEDVLPNFEYEHVSTAFDWSKNLDESYIERESQKIIEEAVEQLPPDYKVVFILRDVEGLSNKEIGDYLNLSIPNVKTRIHRSRLMLRKKLSEYFEKKEKN